MVLVAIGRRPVTAGLGLENVGIEQDKRGRIVIDDQFNTSVKGVRAVGDVTFGPMLAHKAEEEGKSKSNSNSELEFLDLRYRVDRCLEAQKSDLETNEENRYRSCRIHQARSRTCQL